MTQNIWVFQFQHWCVHSNMHNTIINKLNDADLSSSQCGKRVLIIIVQWQSQVTFGHAMQISNHSFF